MFKLVTGSLAGLHVLLITLVTAVEALLDQPKRSDSVQLLMDQLEVTTKQAAIDQATKDSIGGGLQRLRYQSIGEAGRALVSSLLPGKAFGGKSAVAFFSSSYTLRSNIVHDGTAGHSTDVSQLASTMEEFVAHLLLASLSATAQQAAQAV